MDNNLNDNNIERYLNSDMTAQEQQEFETALHQSPTLRVELQEHREMVEGIRCYGRKILWQQVRQLEKEVTDSKTESKENPKNDSVWWFRSIAASVLIFMIGFSYYWNQEQQVNNRLFNKNFEVYSPPLGPTRGGEEAASVLDRAYAAYYGQNYQEAIGLFKEANQQAETPYNWFYLGNAYLSTGQSKDAIEAFQKVLAFPQLEENKRIQSHWYLGLAYLKQDNQQAALEHLNAIKNTDHTFGRKARDLLKAIN